MQEMARPAGGTPSPGHINCRWGTSC